MKVTATNQYGEAVRLSLPAATWEGNDQYGTGVKLEAIFVSPRARRCVTQTYSIWENGHGACTGTRFHLIEDEDQLNRLAAEYPCVGEALEKAGIITAEAL
jgi:hypothetical protein